MEKATTYALVGAILVLVGGAFYLGWHLHKAPPAPPPVVQDLTPAQRQAIIDSMDEVLASKLLIVKRGHSVSRGKDTVYVETSDTTTINGLMSFIAALSEANSQVPTPSVIVQQAAPVRTWGLSVGGGGLYTFREPNIEALFSVGIRHKKNQLQPLLGLGKDGVKAGVIYSREF